VLLPFIDFSDFFLEVGHRPFQLFRTFRQILVILALSFFKLVLHCVHIFIRVAHFDLMCLRNFYLKPQNQIKQTIQVFQLNFQVINQIFSFLHIFAVIHKILYKMVRTVMDRPVQLMVQINNNSQVLLSLLSQNLRDLIIQ
jgi:hypothetical protein